MTSKLRLRWPLQPEPAQQAPEPAAPAALPALAFDDPDPDAVPADHDCDPGPDSPQSEEDASQHDDAEPALENIWFPFHNQTQAVLAVAGPRVAFTRAQYGFLVKLVNAQWFDKNHLPSYRLLRNLPMRLPTIPASSESVPTTQGKDALLYSRSLFLCIRQQLSFPGVLDAPDCVWQAEVCARASSPLHGHRARSSPLFTLDSYKNNSGEFRVGNYFSSGRFVYLLEGIYINTDSELLRISVKQLLTRRQWLDAHPEDEPDLPGTLGNQELILVNYEQMDQTPSMPVRRVNVLGEEEYNTLSEADRAAGDVFLHRVTYADGEFLPSDRFAEHPAAGYGFPTRRAAPEGMRTLRLFLLLFVDAFGALKRFHYPVGGVYATLGNFPPRLRRLLRHMFVLALVPPGASILAGLKGVVDEVLELQAGVVLDLGHARGKVFVVGGVGAVVSDFPEGNELSDSMGPGATRPCRCCDKEKCAFHSGIMAPMLTEVELRRRQQQMKAAPDASTVFALESLYGSILQDNPLRRLLLERPLQVPYEPFHCEGMGIGRVLLDCLLRSITDLAALSLSKRLAAWPLPQGWPRMPSLGDVANWRGKDHLRFTQLAPFVLRRQLPAAAFNAQAAACLRQRVGNAFPERFYDVFVAQAEYLHELFREEVEFGEEGQRRLWDVGDHAMGLQQELLGEEVTRLPNFHVREHAPLHRFELGPNAGLSAQRFEARHKDVAEVASNYRDLIGDMMRADTAAQAARFVLAGGALDADGQHHAHPDLVELLRSDPTVAGLVENESVDDGLLEQRCTDRLGQRAADAQEQRELLQFMGEEAAAFGAAVQLVVFDSFGKCTAPCRLGALPVLVGRDYYLAVESKDQDGGVEVASELVRVLELLVPRVPSEPADGRAAAAPAAAVAAAACALAEVGPTLALVRWYERLEGDRATDKATGCPALELHPLGGKFARLVSVRSLTGPAAMEHLCTGSCKVDDDSGVTQHSAAALYALNTHAWNTLFRA